MVCSSQKTAGPDEEAGDGGLLIGTPMQVFGKPVFQVYQGKIISVWFAWF